MVNAKAVLQLHHMHHGMQQVVCGLYVLLGPQHSVLSQHTGSYYHICCVAETENRTSYIANYNPYLSTDSYYRTPGPNSCMLLDYV